MVSKSMKRALSECFLLSIFSIVAMGLHRTDGSKYAKKIITTEYGDKYDCVDFYKQPAFDHPLLQNHSFHHQMRPTFQPRSTKTNGFKEMNASESDIIPLKNGGCPPGTVPIRKMNKRHSLSGTKAHPQRSSKNPNSGTEFFSGNILAISETQGNPSRVYDGVGAVISIYNPRALAPQYSSGEIIIKGGTDSIIAGWTVNPNKYRDTRTRFFIYSVAGDMHCFNSACGFVQVRSDIPLDFVLAPISKRGGQEWVNKFFIYREPISGNWWLQVGMKKPPITLGFWPQRIFAGLQRSATYAACGGEVYTTASLPPPEMGSGYYPHSVTGDYAYCEEFVVVDGRTIIDAPDTVPYTNNDAYSAFSRQTNWGHLVVPFGGPNLD